MNWKHPRLGVAALRERYEPPVTKYQDELTRLFQLRYKLGHDVSDAIQSRESLNLAPNLSAALSIFIRNEIELWELENSDPRLIDGDRYEDING